MCPESLLCQGTMPTEDAPDRFDSLAAKSEMLVEQTRQLAESLAVLDVDDLVGRLARSIPEPEPLPHWLWLQRFYDAHRLALPLWAIAFVLALHRAC